MTQRKIILPAAAVACVLALFIAGAFAAGAPGQAGQGNGGSAQGSGSHQYTTAQTISDQAQQNTLAFDALAFITGDACSDTFLPPGKVADYAGFQYLRDNDATGMGHNTDFVTRASDNVLITLNDAQLAQFVALSQSESALTTRYALMRFPLTTAFRAQLEGKTPSGSSGLSREAVMDYSAELYDVDASISIARAKTYAGVINSLNASQRAYLDRMKSGGMLSWPVADASEVLKRSGQGNSVAMRTYASEMFAWYAGSVEADVYFCPERQATYFGSFYMKDRPAMGNAGYSISTSLTGDSGAEFINTLTAEQRTKITGLVDLQRADLNEIVSTREAIATELRRPLYGGTIDEARVRALSARYGELDGEISYLYATHFAEVGTTLSGDQKAKMVALRNLAGYTCAGAYLYSQPIAMPQNIPSDFLFGTGSTGSAAVSPWIQGLQLTTASQQPGAGKPGQGNITGQGPGSKPRPVNGTVVHPEDRPVAGNRQSVQPNTGNIRDPAIGAVNPQNPGRGETSMPSAEKGTGQEYSGWLMKFLHSWFPRPVESSAPKENPAPVRLQDTRAPEERKPVTLPPTSTISPESVSSTFSLTSGAGPDGSTLPAEYSCDGAGVTPALSWTGAPEGTKEFALMMTTIPVDGSTRWNWVLYHIPATATGLARNSMNVGTTGTGSHGTVRQYDPPCPQGPGAKTYTFTLYALSASPSLPVSADQVTGQVLTDAINSITLAKVSWNIRYARPS